MAPVRYKSVTPSRADPPLPSSIYLPFTTTPSPNGNAPDMHAHVSGAVWSFATRFLDTAVALCCFSPTRPSLVLVEGVWCVEATRMEYT